MPLRIAIFDDNKDVRESISLLLQTEKEFAVTGCFSHMQRCVSHIHSCLPDVVVISVELLQGNCFETIREIKKEFPSTLVLVKTCVEADCRVFNGICAGAAGYVVYKDDAVKFIDTVKELIENGSTIHPFIARKILTKMQELPVYVTPRLFFDCRLASREKELLACIVNGLTYEMIAAYLFISVETVNALAKKIYKKLQTACESESLALNESAA